VTVARLEAVLSARTADFDRDMSRSEGRLKGVGKVAGAAGLAIAAGLAVGAKKAINDASNLAESVNAVEVVFGDASKQVFAFGDVAARQAGLSMREFNQAVTPIGASLRNVGFSAGETAKASISLTRRAADMASVFNTDVNTVLQAIQAGLRGEVDPLEKFGVGLSAAAVQAHAMELGLAKTTKGLTAQDLAQARVALLMEQTHKLQGDFVNTSGSMANQQRILSAEFENVSAKLGEKLLPAVTAVLDGVLRFVTWLDDNPPGILFGRFVDATKRKFDEIRTGILDIFNRVGTFFTNLPGNLWQAFSGLFVAAFVTPVRGAFTAVTDWLKSIWKDGLTLLLGGIPAALWTALSAVWEANFIAPVRDAFNGVTGWLRDNWREALRTLLGGLPGALYTAFRSSWGEDFLGRFRDLFRGVVDWIKEHIVDAIVDLFKGLPGQIAGALGGLGGKIAGALGGIGDALAPAPAAVAPHPTRGVNLLGARPELAPFALAAAAHGLRITSGLRPGAITASGRLSDHAIGKAIDVSNGVNTPQMAAFFNSLVGNSRVKQAFYDPRGSIFGGRWSSYRQGGHSDHVHVATYDQGGWLAPHSRTLAINRTPYWEPVGPPGGGVTVNVAVHGSLIHEDQLVEHIRTGLLKAQNQGKSILRGGGFA
jgi:hypothetical protein